MLRSLRSKLSLAFFAVTLCCGVIAGAVVDHNVRRATTAQFEDRLSYETTMLGQMTASALFGAIDPKDTSLSEGVGALGAAVHTQLSVIANDGTIVADSSARDPKGLPNQQNEPEIVNASVRGVATAVRGGRMYVAGAIVRDGKTLGFARSSVSLREVTAQLDVVRGRMMIGIGVALALALLLGLAFASGLVRPIKALADGARRVGGGNFTHSIRVSAGDELGELAKTFNEMTRNLQRAVDRLDARNRDMRLVLDNVAEGLLTIDRAGRMSAERSAVVDQWFGPPEPQMTFEDYVARIDRSAARSFRMNWEAILEGVMPVEVSLDQLPRRITGGGRHFALDYTLLGGDGAVDGMLIVIADMTARIAAECAEERQREMVVVFERVMRDKHEFLEFFEEAQDLVASLCGEVRPALVDVRRQLHTLKGNAGLYGLTSLAKLTHQLEDDISELGDDLGPLQRAALREHWDTFANRIDALLGERIERRIEVDNADYEWLMEALAQGRDRIEIARRVAAWRLELAGDRLERFAGFARALAVRLGKAPPEVVVSAERLRLSRQGLARFWGTFAHVVRNAVDHGIEDEAERIRAGKSPAGQLWLRASASDDGVAFEISDDGRGVDWSRVAVKARESGLAAAKHEDLVRALFHDGLSTRDEITGTSGRGVGMAAVRAECERLGGRVSLESDEGKGTTVRVVLPWGPSSGIEAAPSTVSVMVPTGATRRSSRAS